ncbi:MFS general substrate transporter [Phanerochaete sordida]|uniref:MFS general substrate transporter n=1 Tax=Phanerochaete sordida TaxID=48140 RepID=A0A9P3GG05_9APHY|nr:MFS general substrate transporter [Phanerochaete sordida]
MSSHGTHGRERDATHASKDIEKLGYDAHEAKKTSAETSLPDLSEEGQLPPPPTLSAAEEKALYRKVDLRLMPILTLMYLCSFLDRGNIGNAKLQGLTTQLHLVGNQYNIALALYFVPYCVVDFPASLVTKKFRPSRWLPVITMTWGVIMALMGIVKTYPQLVGVRIALGAAEAGFFPGVAWYLSMWYPRHALQFRIGLFWGGATVAGAFSGILAYGISFMSGVGGRLGWSWIFILEGCFTVLVGFAALFILIDMPTSAKFLTPEEQAYIIWRKKYDNSLVGEEENWAFKHLWDAFTDWQLWTHVLVYMSIIGPLYGISFFLPSIINGFGFSPAASQLLTVPPYVFATIVTVSFALLSDRTKHRFPFILAGHAMCLLGFGIQISNVHFAVKYFGTFFCVAGSYSAFPGVITWLANNVAGQYKRGAAIGLHIGFGNFAGSIASVLYRTQDAPRYILGDALELMFVGIGITMLTVNVLLYRRINAQRDRAAREADAKGVTYTTAQLRALGDRAPDFRYTL